MSKINFKPRNDWMLVRPNDSVKRYGKHFIAADDNRFKPDTGEVLRVGDGKNNIPIGVPVGSVIMYQTNGCVDVMVGEEKLLLVNKNQLLGEIENGKD